MSKINQINEVLKEYFELNKSIGVIPAKDMMPYFILSGVSVSYTHLDVYKRQA